MPGHSVIGRFATLDSSSVMCPVNPGSMKPAVEWVSRPSRPSERLALQPAGEVVGQRDDLERRAEHELARVQHERLVAVRLDQRGQVVLLHRRVDVGVPGVVEDPEVAVQPDVDARRLDQLRVERVDAEAARVDLGRDVAVGQQHGRKPNWSA